ncbi:MAG: bifunctional 5,10-methylene-tetrahydrofolate dehydrogenase/5,10-methylene-tetrahydrofolate cyclohydrolase, partial [Bacteroidetes bacterium]|nr:bifunctional 5,10-methylene-tetrahydrofolate dehydrogenase/5,10-methylene-tetrahydrofolate cyclohydrolase [Bacteroidota bacterium]
MQILDGTATSASIKKQLKHEVDELKLQGGKTPHLAVIMVGNNPASEAYVGAKVRTCEELGFNSTLLHFDPSISEEYLLDQVNKLNNDDSVDGILVQLPLPDHLSPTVVI